MTSFVAKDPAGNISVYLRKDRGRERAANSLGSKVGRRRSERRSREKRRVLRLNPTLQRHENKPMVGPSPQKTNPSKRIQDPEKGKNS